MANESDQTSTASRWRNKMAERQKEKFGYEQTLVKKIVFMTDDDRYILYDVIYILKTLQIIINIHIFFVAIVL